MSYTEQDCARCRADFPALARTVDGAPVAFLDGPGGTQVPNVVLDAIRTAYIERNANYDGRFATSVAVTAALARVRTAVAELLGAPGPEHIAFGANMTSLNFALSHALVRGWSPGDEVLITELDHEANRGPWLKLAERGIGIREARLLPNSEIDLADLAMKLSSRTRLVAVTMASNALGTVPPLAEIKSLCDTAGARLLVDAVHYAAHFPLDVVASGVDFLLCSAYKFYGPHIGILYARDGHFDELDTDRLRTQKQAAPYRMETGTLNHAALAGVEAAIDYLAGWGKGETRRARLVDAMHGIHVFERELAAGLHDRLRTMPGVTVWGPGFGDAPRAPTVSFTLAGVTPEAIASNLAAAGIQVWHGHFYAMKVLEVLDLVASGGLLRVGFSMYNDRAEVDRLCAALDRIVSGRR